MAVRVVLVVAAAPALVVAVDEAPTLLSRLPLAVVMAAAAAVALLLRAGLICDQLYFLENGVLWIYERRLAIDRSQ